ncbi:hypothetical protein GCM10022198_14740 [Klugiella xanthotipulae]|uniref:Uncharacterized protein n=1 Tax=Klugiella xanthotipulae TaxID=244735 RepID=A0A543I6L9_9MICO|nr:hypothetical protein [Klugiella xanthotipulae]TQM66234.1 hypothetical protein FB466_1068 [Klugiella xanthotipulae]
MSRSIHLNSMLAEMREAAEELTQQARHRADEIVRVRAEGEDAERLTAQKRRAGDWGADWRTLQGRIDLNQTSAEDIYNGLDHSPEARAVRRAIGQGLAMTRAAMLARHEAEAAVDPFTRDIATIEVSGYDVALVYREELLCEIQSEIDRRG